MTNIHHAKILKEMKIFYEPFFCEWNKLYDSLLQPNQHCALTNKYFKCANELIHSLKLNTKQIPLYSNGMNAIHKIDKTRGLKNTENNYNFKFNDKYKFEGVGLLNVFTCARFPSPQKMIEKKGDILPYYLMDLSSLLPVMSLDIQPDDCVLDMCAAPGGKGMAMLQLLSLKGQLVCNEFSKTRLRRLRKVINEFVPETLQRCGNVISTNWNGTLFGVEEKCSFDKVLVDAPCSSERHVVQKEFQYGGWSLRKMKENVKLQTNLLLSGLRSVKPGGIVTYSTCSVSPLENESVVKMALNLADEDGMKTFLVDKESVIENTVNKFGNETFYIDENISNGVLVLPSEFSNWGPMYFAKIVRLE